MFTRMEKGMKLYLRIEKLNNKKIDFEEKRVPIEKKMFEDIKEVAEEVRQKKIPKLMKI